MSRYVLLGLILEMTFCCLFFDEAEHCEPTSGIELAKQDQCLGDQLELV